jgi:hypothetical protein
MLHPRLAGLARALCLPALLWALTAGPAQAQGLSCSNDGAPAPRALLDRFMDADCSACWSDPRAPRPPPDTVALDWVLPSARGEDAVMSAVALPEALQRWQALGLQEDSGSRLTRRSANEPLRVVQGFALHGYLGAILSYRPRTARPYSAWMLLLEVLPAGTEGSAVPRQLVRAAVEIRPGTQGGRPAALSDIRAFRIPEGAQPERLRVLAWVQDAQGRLRGLGQTHCVPD